MPTQHSIIVFFLIRNGSVIATLGFIFAKQGHNYLGRLTAQVAAGKLGGLDVATDYVAAGWLTCYQDTNKIYIVDEKQR